MDENTLWNDIVAVIREQPPTGRQDEYWIRAKYKQKSSKIRPFWNQLTRITEKDNEQSIPKTEILRIAKSAIDSPTRKFCIKGYEAEDHGRYGSIVCAILDLLPYFSYEKDQILVYSGND